MIRHPGHTPFGSPGHVTKGLEVVKRLHFLTSDIWPQLVSVSDITPPESVGPGSEY